MKKVKARGSVHILRDTGRLKRKNAEYKVRYRFSNQESTQTSTGISRSKAISPDLTGLALASAIIYKP